MESCATTSTLSGLIVVLLATSVSGNPLQLPAWGATSWDDKLPVLFYGSNCTGFDSPDQLRFVSKFDLAIYLFPVNQRNAATLGSNCAADAHSDGFGLTQAAAVRRANGPPVIPYLSSIPLALAFFDAQKPYMPLVNVSTRSSSGAQQYQQMYLHAQNGTILGPVGNTDLWFDYRNSTARQVYTEQMVGNVATSSSTSFPGSAQGTIIGSSLYPGCVDQCKHEPECSAVSYVSMPGSSGFGQCNLLSNIEYSNRDPRYATTVLFQNQTSPASGFFFDNPDWGVCGAIRQFSDDPSVTDELLASLYNDTVSTMISSAQVLNQNGQVPIFAVTNGFFEDPSRGGSWPEMPGYQCPYPYEVMFQRLQESGISWMRFYEFQWPEQGGLNCDLVLGTAAKEAAAGVPLVVHGVVDASASTLEFQLAGFLLTATSNYSYFGASSSFQDDGWVWHKEYDVKYGVPLGALQRNGSFYYRELRNYHVHLDCSDGGQGAHILPKQSSTVHERLMRQRFKTHT